MTRGRLWLRLGRDWAIVAVFPLFLLAGGVTALALVRGVDPVPVGVFACITFFSGLGIWQGLNVRGRFWLVAEVSEEIVRLLLADEKHSAEHVIFEASSSSLTHLYVTRDPGVVSPREPTRLLCVATAPVKAAEVALPFGGGRPSMEMCEVMGFCTVLDVDALSLDEPRLAALMKFLTVRMPHVRFSEPASAPRDPR